MTDGGRDHGLARLDGLGDPAELRARAAQAMRDLDPDPRPSAPQQGADPSDSVWVTVDMVGTVVDVSISRCWPDRLAADQLGDAILAAYSRARAKRAAAIALARMRVEEAGSGPDGGDDDGRPTAPYDPNMPEIHDARWLGWVWHSLGEAMLRLDALAAARPGDTPAERTLSGPAGHVRLRAVGRAVTGVLVDAADLAAREPDLVAVDARAAFGRVDREG